MKPLGLYLHIPFCRSKCAYCDFYSVVGRSSEMGQYAAALCRSIEKFGTQAEEYTVDTVYFGGGTPSWFGAERIEGVLSAVRSAFSLSGDCEITMEANPDSVTEEGLTGLRQAGINRLSMGVQSAQEGELTTAGRPHTFAQARRAVEAAREAGFDNLSLDLIYGLPGQTMEGWQDSVERVLALKPEHLSCYGLKVEEGTRFWQQRDQLGFPDEDTQAEEYLWLCRRLHRAGFSHYEISNFALPGRESRHNLKYWTLGEYLGFGPAAHSDFGGVRFGYARDLPAWLRGEQPRSEEERIGSLERLQEYVMLGLRLERGIGRAEFEARGGINWDELERVFRQLEKHGLTAEQDGRWRCTDAGFLVNNGVLNSLPPVRLGAE